MTNTKREALFERSKHPLIVLAVSTVLGAVLIPTVTTAIAQQNRRLERRTLHAAKALELSGEAERALASVLLEFKSFVEYESVADLPARAALRQRVRILWSDFDRTAWWWHWSLLQEAAILRLVDQREAESMRSAVDAYQANLTATTEAIEPLSALLMSDGSRSVTELAARTLEEVERRARSLQNERTTIVGALMEPLLR